MMAKYRPSNGTEGEFFMERYCYHCKRDVDPAGFCEILARSMAFGVDEPDYPSELVRNEDGIGGTCIEFEAAAE